MRYFSPIILSTLGILYAVSAFAQSTALPLALSLEIQPPSPSPGQSVTISAATPTLDTATTFFDWTVDKAHKPELSGYGNNTIQLAAGDVGTSLRVDVAVTGAN